MVKFLRQQDPFLAREQQKYAKPVPSREFIKQQLLKLDKWCSADELIQLFELVDEEEIEAFCRRLQAMAKAHQIRQNRKGLYAPQDPSQLVQGKVIGLKDGYGLLGSKNDKQPLYVAPRAMRSLFPGDEITVKPDKVNAKGRLVGNIIDILQRNTSQVVGVIEQAYGKTVAIPVNPNNAQVIAIVTPKNKIKTGDYVLVDIIDQPQQYQQPKGQVIKVLGDDNTPGIEAEVMIHAHDLPHEWPEAVEESTKRYKDHISQHDRDTREDLTALPLITIDGEDAKDFDDAVFAERLGSSCWRLVVAIADVSAFVPEDSPIDLEASLRGTSTYFPYRVVPMLPEILSNDLCSLRPKVERLAMVCDMQISNKGQLKDYRFYPAVIRSQERLTYSKVAGMIQGQVNVPDDLTDTLTALYEVYEALLLAKEKRGALDFDSQEVVLQFDDALQVTDANPVPRTDAHRLIEECMLVANVAAANFLAKNKYPGPFRNHESPDPTKLTELHRFLNAFGVSMDGELSPEPKDFAKCLKKVRSLPEAAMLQTVILRSMKQAMYSVENKGHFGLAHTEYLHFTSPIRRYPDLLVHRSIKAILHKDPIDEFLVEKRLVQAEHCSMTERRAEQASRECTSWLKCQYMVRHIGETFTGTVTGVMSFGLFIGLDDNGIEGLVHVSQLGNDYFEYDEVRQQMLGSRSRKRYRIGDAVTVTVARVSIHDRQIDFSLDDDTPPVTKPGRRSKSRRRR